MADFYKKLLLFAPLGYWPLWEASGSTAADISGNGYDGTLTNATFGAAGIGDGHTALACDGNEDYVNINAGGLLSAAFDGNDGTSLVWLKTSAWADSTDRDLLVIYTDVNNYLVLNKQTTANKLIARRNGGGAGELSQVADTGGATDWQCFAMTWSYSADAQKTYLNGAQVGATVTGIGSWSGAPTILRISYVGTAAWDGSLAHVALWDRVLAESELAALANSEGAIDVITDRAQLDINTRTSKAFFNVADWRRIDGNSQIVKALIDDRYITAVPRTATTEPTLGEFADVADINDLVGNIDALRVAAVLPAAVGVEAVKYDYDTGIGAVAPDYEDVNTWERNLSLLDEYVSESEIYGASWDGSSDPALTRTDDAVGMTAAVGVDSTPASNDFDSAQIFGDIAEVTDAYGNTFVRIPRFYIEKTAVGAARTWRIARFPFSADCYLPWCFWDFTNDVELDYIDVGKYPASLSTTNKLQSVANVYPMVSQVPYNMRTYARANGAGYQLLDVHIADVLQTLFRIEFATLNSQALMAGYTAGRNNSGDVLTAATSPAGNTLVVSNTTGALYAVGQAIGVGTSVGGGQKFAARTITAIQTDTPSAGSTTIIFDGAAVALSAGNVLYNVGWKNGFSREIIASSGSLVSNSTGKYPMVYRGLENLYGNGFEIVDCITSYFDPGNIDQLYVLLDVNASTFTANAPYVELGYSLGGAGYIQTMGYDADYPFAELPTITGGGSATTYYADYAGGRGIGLYVAAWGGHLYGGANSGLFAWTLQYFVGAAYNTLGARLACKGA